MVQSQGTLTGNYCVDIDTRGHHLLADEPEESGGTDQGPAPTELVCAALTACTSITLKMYLDRKQWSVERIHVTVAYDDAAEGGPVFLRTVEVSGQLDSQQHDRLLAIANACPVHKILARANVIETNLAPTPG